MEIERLFCELASESRLSILEALKEKDCKMNDLSRNLDLSTTETFRQLQRLSEASLARKQPEGTYAITEYGKLVLGFSSPLGFLLKNKQFFLTHDVQCLPAKFIMRLEILSQATFLSGMVESTTKISNMIGQAKYFMWAISPEPLFQSLEDISKEIPEDAQYRVMSPQPYMKLPNIENRTLSEPPLILALTEKQAAVCFRLIDGKVDYTCFFGEASGFHEWVKDLFCYFWDRGNRV